jgi:hypothetical protein
MSTSLVTPMNSSQRAIVALIFLVPVLVIALGVWWIPQKWQACGKLYDNVPTKIICLNSGS